MHAYIHIYIYIYHWYQKRCRCIRLYKLVVLDNHIRQKLIIDPDMYDCMTVHTCHWYCVYCVLHSQTQFWYTFVFMTCTVWLVAFFGWQVGQPAFDITSLMMRHNVQWCLTLCHFLQPVCMRYCMLSHLASLVFSNVIHPVWLSASTPAEPGNAW